MASERDLAAVHATLVRALPGGERLTAVRPLLGGHSNETYILEGMDAILRLPPLTEPLLAGHDVVAQARIYQELAALDGAPPVPAILHLEEDKALLGDPFFVMEMVRGVSVTDYDIPDWFKDATSEQRAAVSRQWPAAIGSLAALAPLPILGATASSEDEARKWRAMAEGADAPELVRLFDRLLASPAPRSGPTAPVHGDSKIANLMWSDFSLSAVLDWELAYNGEPLADLGYLIYFFRPEAYSGEPLPNLPGMIGRDEAVARWEESSGRSAAGWEWHEAAAIGKMTALVAHGYKLAAGGHDFDPRWQRWKARLDANVALLDDMLR